MVFVFLLLLSYCYTSLQLFHGELLRSVCGWEEAHPPTQSSPHPYPYPPHILNPIKAAEPKQEEYAGHRGEGKSKRHLALHMQMHVIKRPTQVQSLLFDLDLD